MKYNLTINAKYMALSLFFLALNLSIICLLNSKNALAKAQNKRDLKIKSKNSYSYSDSANEKHNTPIQDGQKVIRNNLDSATENYDILVKKLDQTRNNLSVKTGGSAYNFNQQAIKSLPLANFTSIDKVIARAPGVTQDSFGQVRIRADHSGVQYRINGVMIPEGISGFGQLIDTQFVDNVELLTGALPAQYGYRTSGVIEITPKSGEKGSSNRSSAMIGSNNTLGFNQQFGGNANNTSYYLNASFLESERAIESTTKNNNAKQNKGREHRIFANFSHLISPSQKINLILASSNNIFNIPNNPNQSPEFNLQGVDNDSINSLKLRQKQSENNNFAIASINGISEANIDYQLALFSRFSNNNYDPDEIGELVFNGVASNIRRQSNVNGLQFDTGFALNSKNQLRFGGFASNETTKHRQHSLTFSADVDGNQDSDIPFAIANGSKKTMQTLGLYLQNEFKPNEKLSLNIGGRYDQINADNDEKQLSPRVGANYKFNDKTTVHSGYARYITPPRAELLASTNIDNFANTTNQAVFNNQNDKIKAERTHYYDLGLSHKIDKNLTVTIDTYYKDVDNLLDEGQFGSSLIYSPFNYRVAKAHGAEFTLDYQKDKLRAFANFSAQKMKAKDIISSQYMHENDELEYIASKFVHVDHDQSYTSAFGTSYDYRGYLMSADALFGSGLRKGFANENKNKSHWQFNSAISKDWAKFGNLQTRIAVVNLFNNRYQIRDGSGIGIGAPQYQVGRSFYLTTSKSF
jgi:outer membrane receptor protein involved in Fe transport